MKEQTPTDADLRVGGFSRRTLLGGMALGVAAALMLLGSAAAPAVAHQARAAEVGSQTQTADPYVFHPVSIMGGGFITGIVAHPTAPGVMYARTDIGSSYRWDPTANQWVPLTDFNSAANYNYQGTESIALDPTDPNRLYLAQGMYTSGSAAMFVSTDRGAHFAIYPTPFRMGANNLGRNLGERLAVNPFSPNELYMGTRSNGLYRSEDHAQTWTQVVNFPITSSSDGIGIVFVIFNPSHPDTIYVGANSPNGLYETTDGGATWQSMPGQPASWNPDTPVSGHPPQSTAPKPMRAALGSNGNLYVTYGDSPGPYGVQYGAVYRYDTASGASTDITPGSNNSTPPPFSPQAWPPGGFCAISVDQNDPKTLVVVSLDRDPGPAIDSMYLSHDGGATWKDVSQLSSPAGTGGFWGHPISEATTKDGVAVPWLSFNWAPDTYGYGAPSPVAGTVKFGWWIAAALIDPANPDHLLYGTGATIYATDDLSAVDSDRAPTWYVQAQGIEETSVLSLISPTSGAHLLSGVGDINGFRHDDFTVPQPMFSDPVFITVNSLDWAGQNSNFVVRVGQNQAVFPGACGLGAYSTDQGTTWTKFPSCVPNATTSSGSGGSIAVDASGRYMVWTAPSGSGGPFSSADRGATWVAPTGLSSRIAVTSDKVQAATFYAFRSGTWYTSTDGGVSYTATPASTTGLPNASATPVVSFAAAGDVWLPLGSNGLWHSTDFGIHWTRVGSAGLVASRFTLGKAAPGASSPALYLWGAAAGVAPLNVTGLYRSDDGGASWVRINDDAHQYGGPAVIQADPRVYGRVYLGMNGRGIVYGDPAALAKGFYQPVDMGGVWNTVKGGSTVPLKFQLFAGPTELTSTSAVKSFTQTMIACPGASAIVDAIGFVTTDGTSLWYDTTGGQFIQKWATPTGAGSCYSTTVTTIDGSSITALFKIR